MEQVIETTPTPSARATTGLRLNMTTRRVDCALGRWTHIEARPTNLSGIVEFMWHFQGSIASPRERTFPNGLLEIIVHLGERYSDIQGDRVSICPETCVTGLQLGPVVVEAPRRETTVLGLRFTAAGAYAVFGRPMHEIAGLTVDLVDLVGSAAAELQARCGSAAGPGERFTRAAEWIDARLRRGIRVDPAIAWTVEQIRRCGGAVSIKSLRDRAGLSGNRIAVAFREQIGVTAKQYARVMRFRRVLDLLNTGVPSLADVAFDAGYYDQPHMTAEFKELSGLTPGEFLHSLRYPNGLSIAE
jgi:AraC-like DNA-binding protein